MTLSPARQRQLALAGLLLLAAVLRFLALDFALPARIHADEPQVVMVAVNAASGQLSPGFFAYPALFPYLAAVVLRLWVLLGLAGSHDFQVFFDAYCLDPSQAFLLVRACSAALGVALVAATWRLGSRLGGWRTGILAAAILAVNTYAVRDSHFATTDIPASLAATLALLAILAMASDPGLRRAALAGAAVGLATATKYPTAALLLPLAVAALTGSGSPRVGTSRRLGALALALGCALAILLITNPYLLLDADTALSDLQLELQRRTAPSASLSPAAPWSWYLLHTLPASFGWAGLLLIFAGVLHALRSGRREWLLLLLAAAALLAPPLSVVSLGDRYLLPAFPLLAVLAALAAQELVLRAAAQRSWAGRLVFGALACALLLPPLGRSVRLVRLLAQPDSRVLAARWIEQNLPAGASIAMEWAYVPEVSAERFQLIPLDYREGGPGEQGAEYIVLSSYAFNRYFMDPAAFPDEQAFFSEIERGPPPLASFYGLPPERVTRYVERVPPGPLDQSGVVGPQIRIYAAPATTADEPPALPDPPGPAISPRYDYIR